MPGAISSLLNSLTAGVTGYAEGEDQAQKALIARMQREEQKKLRDAQLENIQAQAAARRYALEHPEPEEWKPRTRDEKVQFWKDTHPQDDDGPPPGSEAYFNMKEREARIRARYRSSGRGGTSGGSGGRDDRIGLTQEITTIGQQIDDNRSNLNTHDKDFNSRYPDGAPTTRPKDPSLVPGFLSDSTEAAGMQGQRRRLMQRDSTLNADRDKVQSVRRKQMGLELGLSPTSPTAGAGSDDVKSGVPPEAQSLFDEAAAAYKTNPTPENQAKYDRAVKAIARKYGLIR